MFPTMRLLVCLFFYCLGWHNILATNIFENVAFIIMDQPANDQVRTETVDKLKTALHGHGVRHPEVLSLSKDFGSEVLVGGWTYFPLFRDLADLSDPLPTWYVILHEEGRIDPVKLEELLEKQGDPDKHVFVGKALTDPERVIIHHFQGNMSFKFPDASAGLILSRALVADMAKRIQSKNFKVDGLPSDFSIDAEFELALTINKLLAESADVTPVELTNSELMCSKPDEGCAVWYDSNRKCKSELSTPEEIMSLLKKVAFSVKTCSKFHKERLPVIQKTWARAVVNLDLVSEEEDADFGTKVFESVTHNTERGHCMKTEAIIRDFDAKADERGLDWLVIADDDTILSPAKLIKLLNCYDPKTPVAIGQRYGFGVAKGKYGYDYPTGGSGMVFSRRLVGQMVAKGRSCQCHRPDSPDDMVLGQCLASLGVTLTHAQQMHQARPEDYPMALLMAQDPISFHKFWETDPYKTYDKWFLPADQGLIDLLAEKVTKVKKDEL